MRSRIFGMTLVLLSIAVSLSAQQQLTQPVTAPTVNLQGLKPEQIKALAAAAEQLRQQPENTLANLTLQNATPEKFKEWADAGQAAGKAVSGFTKEIGIAADDFLKTSTGRIALYALLWKLGGNKVAATLLNVAMSLLLGLILLTCWWQMVRRFVFNERHTGKKEYNANPLLRWLGFNRKEVIFEKDDEWMKRWDDNSQFWITLWSRVLSIGALALIVFVCWPSVSF